MEVLQDESIIEEEEENKNQKYEVKVLEKVRGILRASNKTVEEVFHSFDKSNIGFISNLQFRNAFWNFNLGLKSHEIDILLAQCELNKERLINWKEFCKIFNTTFFIFLLFINFHIKKKKRNWSKNFR